MRHNFLDEKILELLINIQNLINYNIKIFIHLIKIFKKIFIFLVLILIGLSQSFFFPDSAVITLDSQAFDFINFSLSQ